ncbi:MAG: hypothetical protein A2007_03140 [Verrucomicrobia bacterium GWC2_42_7]|nr:MAG: hypothetical protein A2007_03140 [Verrucomicrobia bacterium GWC2_42_7]
MNELTNITSSTSKAKQPTKGASTWGQSPVAIFDFPDINSISTNENLGKERCNHFSKDTEKNQDIVGGRDNKVVDSTLSKSGKNSSSNHKPTKRHSENHRVSSVKAATAQSETTNGAVSENRENPETSSEENKAIGANDSQDAVNRTNKAKNTKDAEKAKKKDSFAESASSKMESKEPTNIIDDKILRKETIEIKETTDASATSETQPTQIAQRQQVSSISLFVRPQQDSLSKEESDSDKNSSSEADSLLDSALMEELNPVSPEVAPLRTSSELTDSIKISSALQIAPLIPTQPIDLKHIEQNSSSSKLQSQQPVFSNKIQNSETAPLTHTLTEDPLHPSGEKVEKNTNSVPSLSEHFSHKVLEKINTQSDHIEDLASSQETPKLEMSLDTQRSLGATASDLIKKQGDSQFIQKDKQELDNKQITNNTPQTRTPDENMGLFPETSSLTTVPTKKAFTKAEIQDQVDTATSQMPRDHLTSSKVAPQTQPTASTQNIQWGATPFPILGKDSAALQFNDSMHQLSSESTSMDFLKKTYNHSSSREHFGTQPAKLINMSATFTESLAPSSHSNGILGSTAYGSSSTSLDSRTSSESDNRNSTTKDNPQFIQEEQTKDFYQKTTAATVDFSQKITKIAENQATTLPPEVAPLILQQMEKVRQSGQSWTKVSINLSDGQQMTLHIRVSGKDNIKIRFGEDTSSLKSALASGWKDLASAASKKGIHLDAPEFL